MRFQEMMERQRDERSIILCLDVMISSVLDTGSEVCSTPDVMHLSVSNTGRNVFNTGRGVSYCV